MYWLDQAHGAHFEHPSTLLLVNARSGRTQRRKMMWLPLIALLGGIGILFAVFGRWGFLGWQGREQAQLTFRKPGDVALTPLKKMPTSAFHRFR